MIPLFLKPCHSFNYFALLCLSAVMSQYDIVVSIIMCIFWPHFFMCTCVNHITFNMSGFISPLRLMLSRTAWRYSAEYSESIWQIKCFDFSGILFAGSARDRHSFLLTLYHKNKYTKKCITRSDSVSSIHTELLCSDGSHFEHIHTTSAKRAQISQTSGTTNQRTRNGISKPYANPTWQLSNRQTHKHTVVEDEVRGDQREGRLSYGIETAGFTSAHVGEKKNSFFSALADWPQDDILNKMPAMHKCTDKQKSCRACTVGVVGSLHITWGKSLP